MSRIAALVLLFAILSYNGADAEVCDACHTNYAITPTRYHGAGVGNCSMCHTMHNSQDGLPVDPNSPDGNDYLLIAETPTDVCLTCHAGFMGNVFGSDPLNPPVEKGAGNFAFLLEDNLNDGHGGAGHPIPGYAAGHSIVAPSMGVGADEVLSESPGGDFPSSSLGCTSCHDPHGNGSFRMLHGVGDVQNGIYTFSNPAPDAEGISIYHSRESNTKHSAYRAGMSGWCGNCHGEFHEGGQTTIHPSGSAMGAALAEHYELYNGTEDLLGGNLATAYLALVPFEDQANTLYSTQGPTATSQVFCLTCHRAHASSAPDAGRWDFHVTFLHEDGLESGSYPIPDPYESLNQRSLCNKCHVKDEFDRIEESRE